MQLCSLTYKLVNGFVDNLPHITTIFSYCREGKILVNKCVSSCVIIYAAQVASMEGWSFEEAVELIHSSGCIHSSNMLEYLY